MKTNNYYDTLSKVQKQKWTEKQGNLCYYEWFDTLYEANCWRSPPVSPERNLPRMTDRPNGDRNRWRIGSATL